MTFYIAKVKLSWLGFRRPQNSVKAKINKLEISTQNSLFPTFRNNNISQSKVMNLVTVFFLSNLIELEYKSYHKSERNLLFDIFKDMKKHLESNHLNLNVKTEDLDT